MAFRGWLDADGNFMLFYPWFSSAGDKFIEHGHRLLGILAGLLTIALAFSAYWYDEPRSWVRRYSLLLLAGVILQGALGGLRVVLNERVLALVHGCTGPLFLAAVVGMVAVTSRRWTQPRLSTESKSEAHGLLRLACQTGLLAYLQLVVGAIVRHSPFMISEHAPSIFRLAVYLHLSLAAAVVMQVIWLAVRCLRARACVFASIGLVVAIFSQVLLGASSWIVRYGMPAWVTALIGETGHFNRAVDLPSAGIVSAHGAVGSLIVALCTAIAIHVGHGAGIGNLRGSHDAKIAGVVR